MQFAMIMIIIERLERKESGKSKFDNTHNVHKEKKTPILMHLKW